LLRRSPAAESPKRGTAFGAGASAIAEALSADATFVTVEPDPARYAEASAALAGTRAEVVNGRWEDVLPARGPFDLIFFDGGTRGETFELAISLLAPGGILIKDDLTPGRPVAGDPVREALLQDHRLVAVELLTTAATAAIVAVRRP
jgi:predicted O-methyltransferase YrrM